MFQRLLSLTLALGIAASSFAATTPAEPKNLYTLKQEINAYVTNGAYGKEIARVAIEANKYLLRRIPKGIPKTAKIANKRMAVVFDIDETTLSNLRHIQANDYGYVPKVWDQWVAEGQAPAIYPVQTIYDTAIRNHVAVFFITGRKPSDAAGTERNLREVGYPAWDKIFYKPADFAESTRAFKISTRRQLASEGYLIIANIGDQTSDLVGGYAEVTFKLPNPFYIAN